MTYHDPGVPYSTLGSSIYANRKNPPSTSFGKPKQRQGKEPLFKDPGPGPGAYHPEVGIPHLAGRGVTPTHHANTKWAADTTGRTNLGLPPHKDVVPPGPGLYLRSRSAVNLTGCPQQLTSWRNAAAAGWQNYSARECQTPVILSKEHERIRYGTHSPGPMTAVPEHSVGRQLTSQRITQPRCAFARSARFSTAELRMSGAVPGPGAYNY
ncbi:hypothetical protein Agub_g15794 [Astrephomene gubernaculifera]|uniref:Uncharacterized protein n=1 Tax=Astrephomene gubernaculifera TaxID=47775 RepID=A0AAD3E3Q9_9CHLO|nr:hypothetical protein Agub_g15794 [Astrephomene gubernaculifera]